MVRRRVLTTLALLLALPSVAAADDWIRIGSWNIEMLGSREGQSPAGLAEHLFLAGADVLALQEINDNDGAAATRTNTKLDAAFVLLNQIAGQDWTYVLFPNKDTNDKTQLVGVAWNRDRVSQQGSPFRLAIDATGSSYNLWDRDPHAVKFSAGAGKTDFVVISVHMKSNFDGVTRGRAQREEEAETLVARLPAVRTNFGEADIVVIGDTNCLGADEPALVAFADAGFDDLNAADRPTFVSGSSPFDRILVPADQSEFRYSSQYNLLSSNPSQHDTYLSDHHLVMAAFRIETDDD